MGRIKDYNVLTKKKWWMFKVVDTLVILLWLLYIVYRYQNISLHSINMWIIMSQLKIKKYLLGSSRSLLLTYYWSEQNNGHLEVHSVSSITFPWEGHSYGGEFSSYCGDIVPQPYGVRTEVGGSQLWRLSMASSNILYLTHVL